MSEYDVWRKKYEDVRSDLAMAETLLEAMCGALDGKKPSDFMLSFPEVNRAWSIWMLAHPESE